MVETNQNITGMDAFKQLFEQKSDLTFTEIKDLNQSVILETASDGGGKVSKLFTPKNFANFVLTGAYQKYTCAETETDSSDIEVNSTFIIGCGRSGTTLLFELLEPQRSEETFKEMSLKSDEPRELYLSFWSE